MELFTAVNKKDSIIAEVIMPTQGIAFGKNTITHGWIPESGFLKYR